MAWFELCVSKGRYLVSLGEIQLVDGLGNFLVKSDFELFGESTVQTIKLDMCFCSSKWIDTKSYTVRIRERYNQLSRRGMYRFLYRPTDIQFVRFAVRAGGKQVGIYESPLAIPPETEVKARAWEYFKCPMDPLPPIDRRTFYHLFYSNLEDHSPSGSVVRDMMYYNRLPKKLNASILAGPSAGDGFGWGVHIIEGPNKPVIAWFTAIILFVSFLVALLYDILRQNADSGFAIGQWVVAVLTAVMTATYFHLEDIA